MAIRARASRQGPSDYLALVLWPVGALIFLYTILKATGEPGVDLFSIWTSAKAFVHHQPAYYALPGAPLPYPPSSLVLLVPIGVLPFSAAKAVMAVVSAGAAAGGGALLLETFGLRWRSITGAVMLLALAIYGPLQSTLLTGNVNALVFAGEAAFVYLASRGRWTAGCAVLGLTFALKPVLLPLIVLPLLWRRWKGAAVAAAIPAGLTALALVAGTQMSVFFTKVVPFLMKGEGELKGGLEQFNLSLLHAARAFGVPDGVALVARVGVIVLAAALVWLRHRETFEGDDDPLRLAEIGALLLLPAFLSFSSSLAVYALYLIPLFVSVVHPRSSMRNVVAWVGVYFVGTVHKWNTERLPSDARTLASLLPTWGYLILLAVIAYGIRERRAERLNVH